MVHCRAIDGSEWFVCIGGFRCPAIRDVDAFLERLKTVASSSIIQVLNARRVAGWGHLFFAAVNAVKALESKRGLAKNLGIETLLYASCQDQISAAFQLLGVSPDTEELALIVFSQDKRDAESSFKKAAGIIGFEDDRVLEVTEDKILTLKRIFDISDTELETMGGESPEALASLIIERGALLAAHR
ncbi:MAG: KEOPS complex subunit Cgi121 [Candidatus Bathyarchaeia archaeon]